jgi:molecular chaperone DnaK
MIKAVGIDLGTTNSVVAVIEGGEAVVIANSEGGRTTPSVVAIDKDGERLVGQHARRQAAVNPENTISSIKRFMGRKLKEVKGESQHIPYHLIEGREGRAEIQIAEENFTPEAISAMILQKIKADAEIYLGHEVLEAVITVPAYFDDAQRQATKNAGEIAGLKILRIINEPTAASLAYGLDRRDNEKILVFDLGGGTFDVSVLEVGDGVFEVKATSGDTHLGGDDYDRRIVNWVAEQFGKEHYIDLRNEKQALQRLIDASEKAKIELSLKQETEINLPFVIADDKGPKHLAVKITRAKFEQLTEDLTLRCEEPVLKALQEAGLEATELDEVILVGGSTRMPVINELVARLIGKTPNRSVNPDEVVAMGAAIQAGVLQGQVKDVLLLDVTPLSLGILTEGGKNTVMIPRNATIPINRTETFSTANDNQHSVEIAVFQGEHSMAVDNIKLGSFMLEGLSPAPRGVPQIDVTFDIDVNGIINVSAKDRATNKAQKVTITGSTTLEKTEVKRMIEDAEKSVALDEDKKKEILEANKLEKLLYQVEKISKKSTLVIPDETRSKMNEELVGAKNALEERDVQKVRNSFLSLSTTYKLIKEGVAPVKEQ